MSHINDYEYENELSIDPKLLCAICLNPFTEPKITSCEHIFCDYCIKLWYKSKTTCPLCRQPTKKKHLKSVKNSTMLNTLNRLHVQCLLCEQTGIERKDFDDHIDNECLKVIVSCSNRDTKCLWRGKREDLARHRMTCLHKSSSLGFIHHHHKEKKIQSNIINSDRLKIENLINQYPMNSEITLRNQQITDADISYVVQYAIIDKQCKVLDLGNNQIISHGIIQLADSLRNNKTLKMLSLHQNSLSQKSIQYLADRLALNKSNLKWLDLESTDLNNHGAEYLATMLKTNQSITGLWLSNNKIGCRGVKMLASALISSNTTLKYLDLENNQRINDSCLDYFVNMMKENRSLKTIDLSHCQLSITSKAKLRSVAHTKQDFRLVL
ncbi:unnamed protein product [Adineta steineri]|uniref:RING-type domain-containing protein n=1 Tax=Adineta steineri TaxID=433720 RepID=A0A814S4L8_9BILA|nr:unnamed protein product [Adineta steineri]